MNYAQNLGPGLNNMAVLEWRISNDITPIPNPREEERKHGRVLRWVKTHFCLVDICSIVSRSTNTLVIPVRSFLSSSLLLEREREKENTYSGLPVREVNENNVGKDQSESSPKNLKHIFLKKRIYVPSSKTFLRAFRLLIDVWQDSKVELHDANGQSLKLDRGTPCYVAY